MKKISLIFKDDEDADKWMQARAWRDSLALLLMTDRARVLVSTRKVKKGKAV